MRLSDLEWHQLNLLKNCKFFTKYGQKILDKGKKKNINLVKEIIKYYLGYFIILIRCNVIDY